MRKGQYLTFNIANTCYAVNVFRVQEVLPYEKPQKLPCPDPLIAGIIRSRNTNISVINMRKKFGLELKEADLDTHIIVFEVHDDEKGCMTLFGGIVDSVKEVIPLDETDSEAPPELGTSIASRFISGVGVKDGQFIIILNPDTIFSFEELSNIQKISNSEEDSQSENFQKKAVMQMERAARENEAMKKEIIETAELSDTD